MGISDISMELRIARLKWIQSKAAHPEENVQYLSAMFSKLAFEDAGSNALPIHHWLIQLREDLASLKELDLKLFQHNPWIIMF